MANQPKKRKIIQFYLNPRFWIILLISQIVLVIAAFLIFTPAEIGQSIIKVLLDPATYVPLGIVAAGVAGVWSKVKEVMDKAEEKALAERLRNNEIEKKAEKAATVAVALSDRVETNAEMSGLLELRYEALSRSYQELTKDLQREGDKSEAKITKLETQLERVLEQNQNQQVEMDLLRENHRVEIADLRAILKRQGEENTSDKLLITSLQGQNKQLEDRLKEVELQLAKYELEITHLREENHDLKTNRTRRVTDQLPGLSDGDTVRLDLINVGEEGQG